ncbi:MAG: DMT family transporter [Clostridia bacterium]|nr:DMT family transporter [Clostridia bacterium]
MKGKNTAAYISLLITFLLWGSIYVASSYATGVLSPAVVACGRYIAGTAVLWIMARGKLKTPIDKADIKYFILIAALGYYLTITFNTIGIKLSGASVSSVINSMMPVGISIAAAAMLKERITAVNIGCIAAAIAGTVIVMGGGSEANVLGVAFMLGGLVAWSIATIYIKKLSQKYPSEMIGAYAMAMSLVIHLPVAAMDIARNGIQLQNGAVLAVLYMGIFTTGVAQYLWGKSLAALDAGVCSMFYPLQPVFSVILGRLFLSEQLRPNFFIGAGIIALTVVINCLHNERAGR